MQTRKVKECQKDDNWNTPKVLSTLQFQSALNSIWKLNNDSSCQRINKVNQIQQIKVNKNSHFTVITTYTGEEI